MRKKPPLVCKNLHSKTSNNVPIHALSGLVNLQRMTLFSIDHALEEIIPEGLLFELPKTGGARIRAEVPDDIPSASNIIGQEIIRTVSHASSTFEGGLIHGDISVLPKVTQAPRVLLRVSQHPRVPSLALLRLLLWMFMLDHHQFSLRSQR
jgi:hypothetical protein